MHEWMSSSDGSATELDLEPGRYRLSTGCTVARLHRDPPPQRSDFPDLCDLEWDAMDRTPAERLTPIKIAVDGSFLIRAGRGGLHRITRCAGISHLTKVE